MSDHDPFDGIYDEPAAQDDSRSEVTVVAPDDVDVSVVTDDAPAEKPRHLSKTEITRMDKSELQDAARARGLVVSGSRSELQAALRDYQGE
jgi:hypothetical protein